jgi:acetate kinase
MAGPPYVLVLNAGSSSLKVALMAGDERTATFLAERLDTEEAILHLKIVDASELTRLAPNMNHADALHHILQFMKMHDSTMIEGIVATGHRVVHGGTMFQNSVLIDDEVVQQIEAVSHLAPLYVPCSSF